MSWLHAIGVQRWQAITAAFFNTMYNSGMISMTSVFEQAMISSLRYPWLLRFDGD